jgi:hypothetical protein
LADAFAPDAEDFAIVACQNRLDPVTLATALPYRCTGIPMEELIRSNDLVLIATVEALLNGAGIVHFVLDQHMSALEGSLGMLPRRVIVDSDQAIRARRLMVDAELGHELRPEPKR